MKQRDNSLQTEPQGKWWLAGKCPDYRFTLANERTFLAWIRTAVALMAGAVGIEQFSPQLSSDGLRFSISMLLLLAASTMGYLSWRRWRRNEHAMRLEKALTYTRALAILATLIVILAVMLGILLWQGRP